MSIEELGIRYVKVNKYILKFNNEVLIEIEDFTNNQMVDDLLMFKKGQKYNFQSTFKTREECFYHKFFENFQMLFFENGYTGFYKEYDQYRRVTREFFHINGSINGIEKIYNYIKNIRIENNFIDNKIIDKKTFCNDKLLDFTRFITENNIKKKFIETYFKNGNINQKYTLLSNDKIDGEYIKYFENGKIQEHGFYNNGKKEGVHKIYYDNGNISSEITYLNGLFDGENKSYNNLGKLVLFQNYLKNKLHGQKIEYFGNSNIKTICTYIDGCLDGEYKEYYENKNLKLICNFKYDTIELKYMGKNYVNISKYEKNKHGEIIEFYENGSVHKRGNYVNNKLNGDHTIYDMNGDIIKVIKYKNNELIQ